MIASGSADPDAEFTVRAQGTDTFLRRRVVPFWGGSNVCVDEERVALMSDGAGGGVSVQSVPFKLLAVREDSC